MSIPVMKPVLRRMPGGCLYVSKLFAAKEVRRLSDGSEKKDESRFTAVGTPRGATGRYEG